jgi:hypothetical protein
LTTSVRSIASGSESAVPSVRKNLITLSLP